MTNPFLIAVLVLLSIETSAQYYYKDIVATRDTEERMKRYRQHGIRSVTVTSFERDGEQTENFTGQQIVSDQYKKIETRLNTALAGESLLTTWFNEKGQVVRTLDTTDGSSGISEYYYLPDGKISRLVNTTVSAGQGRVTEEHRWFYDAAGQPEKMWRIKNNRDTAVIVMVKDEKGNIAEENPERSGLKASSYYYYYDSENRLTDVVTYNDRARRLLPVYIIDYNDQGQAGSMMVIPEGTDDYQKWLYEYDERGLKTRETAYNKRRELLGRIEYTYKK